MAGTSPTPGARQPDSLAGRLSLAICLAAGAAMLGAGTTRLLRDGSMWLDEASIAYNLLHQTPLELMGPLLTTHSFPRLYLAAINGLTFVFGYHTLVLRILPFVFFVLGVLAWQRLGWKRFSRQPLVLAFFVVLGLVPGTWIAYSATLKQYTLDVLLALVPFLLSDAFFDARLRRAQRSGQLLLLIAPCLVSFTYPIALLARVAGWYTNGIRRDGLRVSPRAAGILGAGLAVAMAGLYWIDMRHTAGNVRIFRFWNKCILRGDPTVDLAILERFFVGWYTDETPWTSGESLSVVVIAAIAIATALGAAEVVRRMVSSAPSGDEAVARWGSRSAGCAFVVIGAIAAGALVRYPLCPGRLTLFALFSLQMLAAEGLYGIGRFAGAHRSSRFALHAAVALLALGCLPTAFHQLRYLYVTDVPENVRPLLPILDEHPDVPVLIPPCSEKQLITLPEWQERDDIYYWEYRRGTRLERYPPFQEFFVLSAGTNFYCPGFFKQLDRDIESKRFFSTRANSATLTRVRLRDDLTPASPGEVDEMAAPPQGGPTEP